MNLRSCKYLFETWFSIILSIYSGVELLDLMLILGFPGSSAGKESACNARDPCSIPGLERSPGEGIGYPLQYSWAFLVAQTVKNLPTVQETWIRFLGWEDPLEESTATYSNILAWRIPHGQRSLVGYSPWGYKESDMTERLSTSRIR